MNKEFAEALAEKLFEEYYIGYIWTSDYFDTESFGNLVEFIIESAKEIQEAALQNLADQAQELNLGYEDE